MAEVEVIKNEKSKKPNYIWIAIIVVFILGAIYSYSSSSSKISGCYYIANNGYDGMDISLCINSSSVTYTFFGTSVDLYPDWIGDTLYIKNEYDDTLFICNASKENNNSIQCASYNEALGSGNFIWEK